jgi:bifunctional DNA-binding transcriptional regulator/antitoxin component of YhaV-PrlF toxin-antitoxin module
MIAISGRPWQNTSMVIALSEVTAEGLVSVPVEIQRRLGIGPGSVLAWFEDGDQIVVRRAGRFTSEEIHQAVFGAQPPVPRSLAELKDGIRRYLRNRHDR